MPRTIIKNSQGDVQLLSEQESQDRSQAQFADEKHKGFVLIHFIIVAILWYSTAHWVMDGFLMEPSAMKDFLCRYYDIVFAPWRIAGDFVAFHLGVTPSFAQILLAIIIELIGTKRNPGLIAIFFGWIIPIVCFIPYIIWFIS